MEPKDYYQVLGVAQNADVKQIKSAYRELALKYHPDRNREKPEMAEKMKAVNEAYAVLSNPRKRQEYDALRRQYGASAYHQFRQSYSEQDIFSGSDINHIFEELARSFGLRGFDDIFREFYGRGYQTFEFKRPGVFGRGFVFTFGAGRRPRHQTAGPRWESLGKLPRFLLGKLGGVQLPQNGADLHGVIRLEPDVARQGGPFAYYLAQRAKKLVVKIPPGVRSGQKIRLAGMGSEGRYGGKPGDLYLKVKVRRPLLKKIRAFISKP